MRYKRKPLAGHPADRHIGGQLRTLREERGLSQMALAERVGISFQQIQKYETGSNRVSVSRLVDLAKALEAPLPLFFDGLASENGAPLTPPTFREPTSIDYEIARLLKRIEDRRLRRQIYALIRSLGPS